jgi:class 3 adenylate cyclase/tetratricopeptide (TPR) repeat protein
MSCSACGEWRRRGTRFCAECGTRLTSDEALPEPGAAVGGLEGELRQLTVAFCDLVGSTEISSTLDPEAFVELLGLYQAAIEGVVARYGGKVVKFLGDGALIVFGWPVANDDDAERAVRAGLELVTAVAALSDLPRGVPMNVRVGIHSGEAFVGGVAGGDHREETVFGETVNIAARLQQACDVGSVLISDATLNLVRGIFITEDRGITELRGIARRIGAHRVLQRGGTRSRFAAGRRTLTRYVGRAAEIEQLVQLCDGSSDGARTALVIGEPGIGKSRLVYEVKNALSGRAHTWMEGQCSSYTSNTTLRPVADALEEALGWARVHPDDRSDHLRAALDRVGLLSDRSFAVVADLLALPVNRAAPAMGADERRRVTYEVLTEWIRALTRHQPLIMVVEDLQWADPSTLELLTYLTEHAPDAALTVLGTARPEFDTAGFVGGRAETITLAPLTADEMRTLVAGLRGPVVDDAVDYILELSSGVPLYAEELSSSVSDDEGWAARSATSEHIPATLQELLGARLDRLGPAKRLAQICAVIGDDFTEDLIAEIGDVDRGVVADALEQLTRERLLLRSVSDGVRTYTFRHALLRDAAYRSLLRRARRDLHARAAASLHERLRAGDSGVDPERVARHYEAARLPRQAVELYRLAAEQCATQAAHSERSAHLTAALGMVDKQDDATRCALLLDLGDALWRAGDYEPARARFLEASAAAEQAADAACLVRAALGYAGRMGFGAGTSNPTLITLLERALDQLPADQRGLRAMVMARLAQALAFGEHGERRVDLAEQALELMNSCHDPAAQAAVYTDVHLAIWGPDNLDQRLALARDTISLAKQAGDLRLEAEGRMWLVADLLEDSDLMLARAEHERWSTVAEQLQDNYQLWAVAVARAMFTLLNGHLADGEQQAGEALRLAREGYNENAVQLFGVQMSNVSRERGRWIDFEEPLKVIISKFPSIATWRAALAAMYAGAGRIDEAREQFAVLAEDRFARFQKDVQWFANMMLAADTCAVLDDAASAAVLYEQLAPYPKRSVMAAPFAVCWGSTSRSLGVLATTLGDYAAAEKHFEQALVHCERLEAGNSVARTLIEYAQMLNRRASEGDAARAVELAARALQLSQDLGLPLRLDQARELLSEQSALSD